MSVDPIALRGQGGVRRKARIFRPARTAMQSGRGNRPWILEFEPRNRPYLDPLMGWDGYGDVDRQFALQFASCEQAVQYAEAHDIAYEVAREHRTAPRPKSYSDNFKFEAPRRTRFPH
jgi:hypothetical protein